jgi:DNA-binding NarL/FixJ family response regulator
MAKNIKTNIICYDDHRGFTDEVRKRFGDQSRYKVISYPTRDEFINQLKELKDSKLCKIAILGAHNSKEHLELMDDLAREVKKIDNRTGIIILGPPENMEEIRKTIKFSIDAYVPKNSNSILRIHNIVKKLISEHNIDIFRKRRNFSLYMLLLVFVLCAVFFLVAWFKLPQYF